MPAAKSELHAFLLGAIAATAVCLSVAWRREKRANGAQGSQHRGSEVGGQSSLDDSSKAPGSNPPGFSGPLPKLSEELRAEQLSRNVLFFGDEGMAKIRGSTVIVVGLGGVGSHAAHLLGRSGVERLVLMDFDQVTLSSTNRHATATLRDVGTPKVEVRHTLRLAFSSFSFSPLPP